MGTRNANYDLLRALEAFEPATAEDIEGTCGNVQDLFEPEYNVDKGEYEGGIYSQPLRFYRHVSAPMLLARLVAGFPGVSVNAEGQEAYKVTWTVALRHKTSGAIVTFYDWKGASSYGCSLDPTEIKGKLKTDMKKLLLALVDPRFPHPYDGCVIGEVA